MDLLVQKLGSGPIEVAVDAVRVIRGGVFEVVGEATQHREFAPAVRVEIRIPSAGISGPMVDAYIGETPELICPDWRTEHGIGEIVVVPVVPLECAESVKV